MLVSKLASEFGVHSSDVTYIAERKHWPDRLRFPRVACECLLHELGWMHETTTDLRAGTGSSIWGCETDMDEILYLIAPRSWGTTYLRVELSVSSILRRPCTLKSRPTHPGKSWNAVVYLYQRLAVNFSHRICLLFPRLLKYWVRPIETNNCLFELSTKAQNKAYRIGSFQFELTLKHDLTQRSF